MLPPTDLDGLSHADLKSLVLKLLEEAAELRRTVAAQRDEIARLKGGPGRPNIKPSGMDKATEPRPPPPTGSEPRQKGGKTSKLSIHEERTVTVAAPPQGSRFKGYTNFVVQDLVIRSHVVNFRRERWQKPDGDMMTAPLPAGISGHFGPELRRFVLAQYHQGQVTVPRLLAQLRAFGIVISKRQLVRLLIAGQDGFLAENREVLRAGLSSAAWVTVDDTGARHKAANGFCTQVGNAHFAWFGTTASKSRLNFLHLLRAGHSDYVINTEALDYMRQRALSSPVIARLAEHPQRFFTSQVAWTAHLDRLGISALEVNPDPVMVATEGALWGSVKSHGFLPDTVIVSDDAGQFNVGPHGLCWVHAERLVHKLDTFTDEQRLPIRLLPTPPTCGMLPGSGVKLCVGRCGDVARDAEQGTEGVERIEPPVEAEGEFVEVGLQVLVTDPVMDAVQPRFQVCEDEMDDRQILLGDLRIAPFSDGEVFVAALGKAGVAAPVVGDERRARHNGALNEAAERLRAAVRHDGQPNPPGIATTLPLVELGARAPASLLQVGGAGRVVGKKSLELWERLWEPKIATLVNVHEHGRTLPLVF